MKKLTLLFALVMLFSLIGLKTTVYAQNGPVLYFCEKYSSAGEESISDRFTTGYLTVMVKCDYALGLSDVSIQMDKYNCSTGKFDYYAKTSFSVTEDMKYIYFEGTTEKINFKATGIYRVYLLDGAGKTVTSSLIEIIK
jgi:hypothetical protein